MATWVGPPKSYSPGRPHGIQYVVIHATDGSEAPDSAENGHHYDTIRTDQVSTHLFVDSNSAVREVLDSDRAHAAYFHGNEIGIHVELCGSANQTANQWHDAASWPELQLAAQEVAALCAAHGLAVRHLTVAEVRAAYYNPAGQRPTGICGHADVTAAYPEDNGDHTDPGPGFPWADFIAMVASHAPPEEDEMAKVVRVNQGGAVWVTSGPHRHWLSTQTEYAAAVRVYGAAVPIDQAELGAFGIDVTASGAGGLVLSPEQLAQIAAAAEAGAEKGAEDAIDGATFDLPAATIHASPASTTGPAVPEAAQS